MSFRLFFSYVYCTSTIDFTDFANFSGIYVHQRVYPPQSIENNLCNLCNLCNLWLVITLTPHTPVADWH